MSVSRRHFLLATSGAVAGLILPSFYEKVLRFAETFGEPLIEAPASPRFILTAVDWFSDGVFELNWGDTEEEAEVKVTVREFANRYWGGVQKYLDSCDESKSVDLDAMADERQVSEMWSLHHSSHDKALHVLQALDIGRTLGTGDAIGQLDFIDGAPPGSNYRAAHAPELISLSLLQQRINELGTGIGIEVLHAP